MGSSVPPIRPDDTSTGGLLHRVLTPDEFHQAQQLPPEALTPSPFPLLPPAAPKDAVSRINPNAGAPDKSLPEQAGAALRNSSVGKSPGLAGILTRQIAAPIVEHPLLTGAGIVATAAYPPLSAVYLGQMGMDVLEYAAQRHFEKSQDPSVQAALETDPDYQASRISGEQVGVEAGMLGLAGAGAAAGRMMAGKSAIPSIAEATQPIRERVADFVAPGLAAERRSLARTANTDALTGLGNQRAFTDALPAAEQDPNTSVIRFDANGFKAVNDTHGHEAGDEVLAHIGQQIRAHAADLPVFRTGGDEFAVFAPKDQAPAIRDGIEQSIGVHELQSDAGSTTYSLSGGVGDTNAEADQAARARKLEQKAAQGIPDRDGNPVEPAPQKIAAAMPSPKGPTVSPELQQAVTQHVADVTDAIDHMTAATAQTTGTASAPAAATGAAGAVASDIAPGLQAAKAKTILRANLGDAAANYEQASFKADEFRRAIDWLPENDKLGFVDAIEGGQSQPSKEFQPLADMMREKLDETRDQIRALGTGKLEQYIENYFPHSGIWADPEQAETTFKQLVGGRRPMEGTKSFLKERSVPTVMTGVKNGLELADGWNPIDVFLSNYRDMQRYLFAQKSFGEAKDQGIMSFVRAGEKPPDGYAQINDKMATVFGKPTVTINEAFDAQQRAGIEAAINRLGGVDVKRGPSLGTQPGLMSGALGYAKGDSEIGVKFGSHDGVLMHELGHIVDNRFGMGSTLAKATDGPAELARLADLRYESNPKADAGFKGYVHQPEEQAANALHAYLHAPETMKEVAPNVYKALDQFLAGNPKLAAIRDIKPSLELGTGTAEMPVGGMVVRGQYYAPKEVATVFNNHLSPGLPQVLRDTWGPQVGEAAARAFEAYKGLGNTLNQSQLGFSAFHLGMTSLDATVSRAALGLEEGASGNLGRAAKNLITAPAAPLPGLAQGLIGDFVNKVFGTDIQMGLGAKIRQAYLTGEGSPEMVQLAQAVREAGGRVVQDSFYKTSAADQFLSHIRQEVMALKDGRFADAMQHDFAAGKGSLPAMLEMAAKPIMEHVVPLQKLQVFGEMAQKALRDLPPDATLTGRRAALQSAWDSVDNRMGQLVYDNLFWNRTFKDLAMASTRSVGWNLGTIRELGGGYVDLAKGAANVARSKESVSAALTHKAAYAIALPVTVGLYGALYQYLRTGEGPSELKDYFYPKTGEQDADGNAERVQLPSYMKDLAAYAGSPWQTVTHKIAPFPSMIYEMLQNKDFFGDEIRNPTDPAVKQIQQEADYIGKSALPFSLTNTQEQTKRGDQSQATKFGNWFGVTPAPRRVVKSDADNLMSDILSSKGPAGGTPEEVERRRAIGTFVSALRGHGDIDADALEQALSSGKMVPADIGRAMKRAGMTPAQEQFNRLSLDDMLRVFDQATDREKALFGKSLAAKLGRVAGK